MSGAQAAPAAKTALTPIRIGLQANVLAVPTKVAIDSGTFFVATFILGAATGRVAAYFTSHGVSRGTGVIARPEIKTIADLEGKKIGGARGTSVAQIFENTWFSRSTPSSPGARP